MVRRSLALLAILTGAAVLALGIVSAYGGNCKRITNEAVLAMAAMQVCTRSVGCQFGPRDLVAVMKQHRAAIRCRAREE